ncbi:MAG: hypothetical protein HQK53_11645 [Oligoflexia bacterium]|nr:hypothetical protein [Oligoflexia bacterium]
MYKYFMFYFFLFIGNLVGNIVENLAIADCNNPDNINLDKKILMITSRLAYNQNLSRAIQLSGTPLCYRESTEESQAFQQMGDYPKPQEVKNKSSTLKFIAGHIPCNGEAGKIGDKLRKAYESNNLSKIDELNRSIANETRMIDELLRMSHRSQASPYQCNLAKNGKKCVAFIFSGEGRSQHINDTEIVSCEICNRGRTCAKILTRNNAPVTADTDLVVVGQPGKMLKSSDIIYDHAGGFQTKNTAMTIENINAHWQRFSGKKNNPLQHGDESFFGLNPIDDMYVCYRRTPPRRTVFNLKSCEDSRDSDCEEKRTKSLIEYGTWLGETQQEENVVFSLPDIELMKARNLYLKLHFGFELISEIEKSAGRNRLEKLISDYGKIENGLHQKGAIIYHVPRTCNIEDELRQKLSSYVTMRIMAKEGIFSREKLHKVSELLRMRGKFTNEDCEFIQEIRNDLLRYNARKKNAHSIDNERIAKAISNINAEISEHFDPQISLNKQQCTPMSCAICDQALNLSCLSDDEKSQVKHNLEQIYSCIPTDYRGQNIDLLLQIPAFTPCETN